MQAVLAVAALVGLLAFGQAAYAHAFEVSGMLYSQPQTPAPRERFELRVELVDPDGQPLEDAVIHAALRQDDVALELDFDVHELPGTYYTGLELPSGGRWQVTLFDRTFPDEDTRAETVFYLLPEENPIAHQFIFPPSRARVWPWLLGLLLAGLGLGVAGTVYVLRQPAFQKGAEQLRSARG